jgi:hypothetical protein
MSFTSKSRWEKEEGKECVRNLVESNDGERKEGMANANANANSFCESFFSSGLLLFLAPSKSSPFFLCHSKKVSKEEEGQQTATDGAPTLGPFISRPSPKERWIDYFGGGGRPPNNGNFPG